MQPQSSLSASPWARSYELIILTIIILLAAIFAVGAWLGHGQARIGALGALLFLLGGLFCTWKWTRNLHRQNASDTEVKETP